MWTMHLSKFVRAMRAEGEFELEEDRIGLPRGEEIIRLQEIVVVLQTELGKLRRIPGEIAGNARALIDGETVRWVGSVGGEDKQRLLRRARAVLFPLRWTEPGGTAIVEAQLDALRCNREFVVQSGVFQLDGSPTSRFEAALAEYVGKQGALLCQSGYTANLGLIQVIADPHAVIWTDQQDTPIRLDRSKGPASVPARVPAREPSGAPKR